MLEFKWGQRVWQQQQKWHLALLVACILSYGTPVLSMELNPEVLVFATLPSEQSLVQNSVRAIVQDQRGFLWIGTLGGLHRFDGHEMILVNDLHLSGEPVDVVRVSTLMIDRQGDLWVAGVFGGLNRIRAVDGVIESFSDLTKPLYRSPSTQIYAVSEDTDGIIWLNNGKFVARLNPAKHELEVVEAEFPDTWGEPIIHHSIPMGEEIHLVGNFNNIGIMDQADGHIELLTLQNGHPLTGVSIKKTARMPDGTVWAFGGPSFIAEIKGNGRDFFVEPHQLPGDISFIHATQDRSGEFWLHDREGRVYRWLPGTTSLTRQLLGVGNDIFPVNEWLRIIFFDRSETMWLGTEGNGVIHHSPSITRFRNLKGRSADTSGFWDSYLWDIKETTNGVLVSGRGELGYLDTRTHQYTRLFKTAGHPVFGELDDLHSILPLGKDRVLLGFKHNDLGVYNLRDKSYRPLRRWVNKESAEPRIGRFPAFELGCDGQIWVLGEKGGHLIDPETLQFKALPPSLNEVLSGIHVRTMLSQQDGICWFGTEYNGLIRFDRSTNEVMTWHEGSASDGLPHEGIRGLHLDQNNNLWIGTYGGLAVLRNAVPTVDDRTVEIFTTADGLPNNTIYDIIPSEDGALWLSTNRGLSRFDPGTNTFRNFDEDDGIANNEFNGGASLLTSRGWAFLGGIDGLTWFHPGKEYRNLTPPQAALTKLVIGDNGPINTLVAPTLEEVKLPWHSNTLEVELAALCYQQPTRQKVSYRISRVSPAWREAPLNQVIRFTSLPSGDLTFEYKVCNNDGVWSDVQTLALHVGTPPWRTPLAILGYLTLVALAAWVLLHRHQRRLKEQEQTKQQLAMADKLTAVGQLAAGMAHDFNNHLQIITGNAELLDFELDRGHPGRGPLQVIFRTGRRASLLTARLLSYAKETDPQRQEVDLDDLVAGLLDMIGSFLGARISLVYKPQPGTKYIHANQEQIEQVLLNMCLNSRDAISEQGTIEIHTIQTTSGTDEKLCICEVRDSGCGISNKDKIRIFDPFYTTKELGKGTGLGLSVAKRTIDRHGGQMTATDNNLGGATVAFSLPEHAPPNVAADKNDAAPHPILGGTTTILVADDDTDVNLLTTQMLTRAGYHVISVKDGQEGIAALDAHSEISIAVLDVVMPVLDGRAVYEHIQRSGRHIPVLFCTGFSFSVLKENEFREINVPVLAKPFSRQDLLSAVKALESQKSSPA